MKFSDILLEAINIDTKNNQGKSAADYLRVMNNKYGDAVWDAKQSAAIRAEFSPAYTEKNHKKRLAKWGYTEEVGNSFKITQSGLDWLAKNPADSSADADSSDPSTGLAKGTKDITKLKNKKFIVPKVGNNSKYLKQMQTILTHMFSTSEGSTKTTYMLGGDPGTGKTSFIRSLATLTGVPLVVIEAPHITQEHLINIPFLVLDGNKTKEGVVQVDDSASGKMKVVQAESNLVTQLKSKTKRSPEQIQQSINKNKVLRDIQPQVQFHLDMISGKYKSILFLDEFYRTASIKIRNVLRNILNGKIGNDKIPEGVYIVMATNINDEGVDEIPLNQDFHLMDYDVSSKEDFMSYMYGKHVVNPEDGETTDDDPESELKPADDSNSYIDSASGERVRIPVATPPPIKMEVWNKFMTELNDNDLGYNDKDVDVRLSPRRLEQMLIAIDAMLPVKSEEEARILFAFIKTNLSNYIVEKASTSLLSKFNKIAADLISETLPDGVDINVDKVLLNPLESSEWRSELQNEIELKMNLGENRMYVPVVSGAPGVGKTSQMVQIGKNLDMGFIQIDVSNLTPEDITGMPIADMSGDKISTEFSDPNLYISIMNEYNEMIEEFRRPGRPYNIVLLFDELNRASVPVFNSIRKVLLEKEFESIKLPADIIITGAINPTDIGAMELTSHTRDVLDIIPSAGHFSNTISYISNKKELKKISDRVGFDLHGAITNVVASLALSFQSTEDSDGNAINDINVRPFWWSDGSSTFYVSPREMTESISNAVAQCEFALHGAGYRIDGSFSDSEYDTLIKTALSVTAEKLVESLSMTTLKQDIQGFAKRVGMKVQGNEQYIKMFESIRTKKSANLMNLSQILESFGGDVSFLDKGVIGTYVKDFSSEEMLQDIATITDAYMRDTDGTAIIDKTLTLFERINKSLGRLDVSNSYTDQLKKYIGGKVSSLIRSDKVDIISVMENESLMNKLDKL